MPTATVGSVDLCYDVTGDAGAPAVLLVAGLGQQLIGFDDELVADVAERGWQVVRFDNRDVGGSTHLHHLGPADLAAAHPSRPDAAEYLLSDMARDAVGLLDHLGVDRAHVVGVSMGGMIAQCVAIGHPERVTSLTSIMSSPGPQVAPPTPEAAAVLAPPPVTSAEDAAAQAVAGARLIGSPAYPADPERVRRRARRAFERDHDPHGVGRQLAAILCSPDRRSALATVRAPALVVHGDADPLIPLVGGQETAAAIPGARLEVVPGMGHDLPVQLFDRLAGLLHEHMAAAEADALAA